MLTESGDEVDQVYFPHNGMLSLLAVLRDGKAIETATVGREGVVGAMAGLGLYKSLVRVVVQMPLACSKIAAPHFRTVAATSDPVRNLCHPLQRGAVVAGAGHRRLQCAAFDRSAILPLAAAMRGSGGRATPFR